VPPCGAEGAGAVCAQLLTEAASISAPSGNTAVSTDGGRGEVEERDERAIAFRRD
jgi:hypothetical protein